MREAISLERAAMAGFVRSGDEVDALVGELGGCLRAVLRDVLCGHLDPALRRVADELREEPSNRCERTRARPSRSWTSSSSSGTRIVGGSPSCVAQALRRSRRRGRPARPARASRRLTRSASAGPRSAATAARQRVVGRLVDAVDDEPAERHPGLAQLAVEEDRLLDRVVARRGDDQERRRGVLEQRADAPGALGEAVDHPAQRAEEDRQVAQQVDAGDPLQDAEDDAGAAAEDAPGEPGGAQEDADRAALEEAGQPARARRGSRARCATAACRARARRSRPSRSSS